jgi:hypothetical protein
MARIDVWPLPATSSAMVRIAVIRFRRQIDNIGQQPTVADDF